METNYGERNKKKGIGGGGGGGGVGGQYNTIFFYE